ncbi:MAG: ferritin family protein [Chloroflexi bacterium]|jgi:rubrerythrin|nr:ferritin family protein [Chloroflexota bacterium]
MEPLEIAVKMEIEGKQFYQDASNKCSDELGKSLFSRLAEEEDFHATKAREIAESLQQGVTVSNIDESFDKGAILNSIFAEARNEMELSQEVVSSELDIVKVALDMEEKSQQFYADQSGGSKTDFERNFFEALKREERGHYLALVDYREYLLDPTSWFTKFEHISLDGA